MGLFRSEPRTIRLQSQDADLKATRAPWSLWADGFGMLAIRSLQIIVVVAIAAGVIFVIQSLTLVTIPLVIALILACAFHPVMSWMRRRGVPSVLATVLTLLGIVVILGLLGWLIVWAVRDQWDALYAQAEDGFQHLLAWMQTLPFDFLQPDQIDEWVQSLTEFV